jgi:hypothetical protein
MFFKAESNIFVLLKTKLTYIVVAFIVFGFKCADELYRPPFSYVVSFQTGIKNTTDEYLKQKWEDGALQGSTPDEAWWVQCDADNNPVLSTRQNILYVDVGVAVAHPAEFVVFRLGLDYSKINSNQELAGNY